MHSALLLLSLALVAQQDKAEKKAQSPIVSKTCGFSIVMPGLAVESFRTEETPEGPLINKIFQFESIKGVVYTVIVADYPGEFKPELLEGYLDGILTGYTQNAGGKLISQKKIKFQGQTAREVTLGLQNGIMHSTYFFKDKRVFQLLVFFSDPKTDKPAEAKKFVDSFRFVKPEGNLTDGMNEMLETKEYRNDGGGYRVKMVGNPQESVQVEKTAIGDIEIKIVQAVGEKGENYAVMYSPVAKMDPPTSPKVMFENGANAAAQRLKGNILSRKAINYEGKPGAEVMISLPGNLPFADGVFMVKMYLIHDRLYQLIYVGPKARTTSKDVQNFYGSFQVDKDLLTDEK